VPALLRSHRHGAIEAHVEADLPATLVDALRQLPHLRARRIETRSFLLESDQPEATLAAVIDALQRERIPLASLSLGAMNLEHLFLALTGTQLRD